MTDVLLDLIKKLIIKNIVCLSTYQFYAENESYGDQTYSTLFEKVFHITQHSENISKYQKKKRKIILMILQA